MAKHVIVFKCNKTVSVIFPPEKYKQCATPAILLNSKSHLVFWVQTLWPKKQDFYSNL